MSRTFAIEREPFDEGQKIFQRSSITVKPGVTVLVGCNGSGKTTMLHQIEHQLKEAEETYLLYDNLHDGGHNAMGRFGFYSDITSLATMFTSSEGEQIMTVLGEQATSIGRLAARNKDRELFILMDAVDSGFSIDNICELKEFLFQTVMEDHPKDVYIICTANSYEMARGEDCIDVIRCKHRKFQDYEEYRSFILETKTEKGKRA